MLAEAMDRYSASAKDLETAFFFLHMRDMGEFPRNMHHPIVDRRVSEQQVQSASAYVESWRDEVEE